MSNQPPNTRLVLLDGVTANAVGEWKEYTGVNVGTLAVFSTDFGSGTVTIQGSTDGGETAVDYSTTYSASTITSFEGGNILVRAKLTGATDPDAVHVHIVPQDRS